MNKLKSMLPEKKTIIRLLVILGILSISTAIFAGTSTEDPIAQALDVAVTKLKGPWGFGIAFVGIGGIAAAMIMTGDFQTWGKRLGVTVVGSTIIVGGAKLLSAFDVTGAVMHAHGLF